MRPDGQRLICNSTKLIYAMFSANYTFLSVIANEFNDEHFSNLYLYSFKLT